MPSGSASTYRPSRRPRRAWGSRRASRRSRGSTARPGCGQRRGIVASQGDLEVELEASVRLSCRPRRPRTGQLIDLRRLTTLITARVRSATSWMDSMSGSARRRSARERESLEAIANRAWPCRHRTPPIRHHWARLRDETVAEVAEKPGEPSGDRTRDPLIKRSTCIMSAS
jgi:hypothetical protein